MAVFQELLVFVSLFVGGQAATCYNSYYNSYYYCSSYYTYYYSYYYYDGTGGIVGGVVGGLFGLGTLITLIVVCICCRRRQASAGRVLGNNTTTTVAMVTQQNVAYPGVQNGVATNTAVPQPGYAPPVGQPGYAPPVGQPAYPPAPGQFSPPTQQAYPVGAQPYPQQPQVPPYGAGNTYDSNTAPMAGGGGISNPGFQPPPSYDSLTKEKQ